MLLYCIVLHLYIYIALLAVHTNQKRFQCERPREKRPRYAHIQYTHTLSCLPLKYAVFKRITLMNRALVHNALKCSILTSTEIPRPVLPNHFSTTAHFLGAAHQTAHCIYGSDFI